ncbi:low affinity immunoglobulin gamma Fc region receptor III-like isoform X2 [Genypterus blacodes]|uniref:low affinity immunoglobulin gamma Fc region receptor III-like isoform X2 n=1 Tax=Genypterus blacodes TaxID=154954 RepID=UPI003F767D1A
MEITAITLLMHTLIVIAVQVHYCLAKKSVFPRIDPSRLQIFEYESVSFACEDLVGSAGWSHVRNAKKVLNECSKAGDSTLWCIIKEAYGSDSGHYWCETKNGTRSKTINITVTGGDVILVSPVLPIDEGETLTLHCQHKTTPSSISADFYKDGVPIRFSPTGEMTIQNVSQSDEGLYKCNMSGIGESPESRLIVRGEI